MTDDVLDLRQRYPDIPEAAARAIHAINVLTDRYFAVLRYEGQRGPLPDHPEDLEPGGTRRLDRERDLAIGEAAKYLSVTAIYQRTPISRDMIKAGIEASKPPPEVSPERALELARRTRTAATVEEVLTSVVALVADGRDVEAERLRKKFLTWFSAWARAQRDFIDSGAYGPRPSGPNAGVDDTESDRAVLHALATHVKDRLSETTISERVRWLRKLPTSRTRYRDW